MQKYVASDFEKRFPGWHRIIIGSDIDHCCCIEIYGDEDLPTKRDKGGIPWMTVGMIRQYAGPDGFWWRVKSAWRALRGILWACELEFWSRKDAERFLGSFKEMMDTVFKEGQDLSI